MDENLVRSALLSARLYADARSHPVLRPEGPGVMAVADAVRALVDDGTSERPATAWLTRFRIAGALKELLHPDRPGVGGPMGAPDYESTASHIGNLIQKVAKTDADDTDELNAGEWAVIGADVEQLAAQALLQAPPWLREHPAFAAGSRTADPKSRPVDWQTEVAIFPRGASKVTSYVEVDGASFPRLAQLCDPCRWKDASPFWFESSRLDDDGRRVEPDPDPDPDRPPQSWSGRFREVVGSTVAVFTVELEIDFQVDDDSCLVQYSLPRPMDGLKQDAGYAYVTKVAPGPGRNAPDRYRTQLVKWVDFEDAPFGGPSVMDQCLPSYIGSWLRVQQDIWAAASFPPA